MAQKAKKKSKLRHAEYYDMQKTFDSLYADSKSGEVFGHLMDIISAPSNIKLAFRNIKGNDGSHTAGTDGRTIESLAVMPEDKFVKLIQKQFRRYEPKAVKRVEIPKPNGKMRPLGIPCIIDRIVQQCILQVMEPICEAKFYEHSYGFRPCRSAENAISYAYGLAQRNKLHYVVDVDVKGFFDNVDHRKLLKQIWTLPSLLPHHIRRKSRSRNWTRIPRLRFWIKTERSSQRKKKSRSPCFARSRSLM